MYIYIYIHICTYIHTYIHIHIEALPPEARHLHWSHASAEAAEA